MTVRAADSPASLGRKDTEFGDGAPQREIELLLQQRMPCMSGQGLRVIVGIGRHIYLHPVPVKHRETVRRIERGKGIGIEHTPGGILRQVFRRTGLHHGGLVGNHIEVDGLHRERTHGHLHKERIGYLRVIEIVSDQARRR